MSAPVEIQRRFGNYYASDPWGLHFIKGEQAGWEVEALSGLTDLSPFTDQLRSSGVLTTNFELLREALAAVRLATGDETITFAPRYVDLWLTKDGRFSFELVSSPELKDVWVIEPCFDPDDPSSYADRERLLDNAGLFGLTFKTLKQAREALAQAISAGASKPSS